MKLSLAILWLVLSLHSHAQLFRRNAGDLCTQNTNAMFADGLLEIDLFLGYYDSSPGDWVVNSRLRPEIIRELTSPCRGNDVCGFTYEPGQPARFTKTITRNGASANVLIRLYNSAHHEFTSYNHTQTQRDLSQRSEELFVDRLKNGEAVFYLGHSRYGGGPDFRVPVLTADWKVDEEYFRANRPGTRLLEAGLRSGGAKLYAAMSCDSIHYFADQVKRTSPRTLFIGTTLTPSYEDNMLLFFSTLGNTIAGECDYNADYSRAGHPAKLVK